MENNTLTAYGYRSPEKMPQERTALYEIATLDRYGNWQMDTIGDNPPRTEAECKADILAFRRGECGPEMAATFANFNSRRKFRIQQVTE